MLQVIRMKKITIISLTLLFFGCLSNVDQNNQAFDLTHLTGNWENINKESKIYTQLEITNKFLIADHLIDTIYYFEYKANSNLISLVDRDSILEEWLIEKLDSNLLKIKPKLPSSKSISFKKVKVRENQLPSPILNRILSWLSQMEENYQPVTNNKVKFDEGIFSNGIKILSRDIPKHKILIENPYILFEQESQVETANLKGKIKHKGNLYYRFNIEEYRFKTKSQANYLKDVYQLLKTDLRYWIDADKYWNDIIQIDNRIIYLSGGHHMPNEMKNIKEHISMKIKNEL